MAFSFWKKMFGADGNGASCEAPQDDAAVKTAVAAEVDDAEEAATEAADDMEEPDAVQGAAPASADLNGLKQFVEYVAKSLVDNPDAVSLTTVEKEHISVIQIRCEKKDIGKIIGKSGKTIAAMRLLVSGAGGRVGLRVTVDVLD